MQQHHHCEKGWEPLAQMCDFQTQACVELHTKLCKNGRGECTAAEMVCLRTNDYYTSPAATQDEIAVYHQHMAPRKTFREHYLTITKYETFY